MNLKRFEPSGRRFRLDDRDPADTRGVGSKAEAERLAESVGAMRVLQERL